eukprot:g972.t1
MQTRTLSTLQEWYRPEGSGLDYLQLILRSRVYDVAIETALDEAPLLSRQLGRQLLLKREDTQPIFSFKLRGAYNKIASLDGEQLMRGLICCSAGNHAQGVAFSGKALGARTTIVMPSATPSIKVDAVRRHGGDMVEVLLHGDDFDEASDEARRLADANDLTFVHPFDDPLVIAGQGTVGMEIIKQTSACPPAAIFVCVGGGGLLAGVASYVKRVLPSVKIIGVETEDAAGMAKALRAGRVEPLNHVGLFADGAAVRTVGNETFQLCQTHVDAMMTVTNDEVCEAIKAAYVDTRVILEPAGALAVAGATKALRAGSQPFNFCDDTAAGPVVAICSGANMDFDRLRFVAERADSSEHPVAVTIPERPGAFRELYSLIFPRNITEFSYRISPSEQCAHIFMSYQPATATGVGISASAAADFAAEDCASVEEALRERGFRVVSLRDNEMAKVHARHLAGGRCAALRDAGDEVLFRFEFPERPGALKRFLDELGDACGTNEDGESMEWNVSLFHYRNHGHDIGRVLVGIQVPTNERGAPLQQFLDDLGYVYFDETDNIVYQDFLL